jgi:hypothetical protein
MKEQSGLVPYEGELPAELSTADRYLIKIRPVWQATPLIKRVKKLLPVDPSSACQRLLNAAGHDLRVKIRTLGLDLVKDVAKTFSLPPINTDEELEDYELVRSNCFRLLRKIAPISTSTSKIELAKKMEISIGRRPSNLNTAQIAIASGAFPFIHKRQQRLLTSVFLERFNSVMPAWRQYPEHSELLDDFGSAGGFTICPLGAERTIVRWMIEAYIGVPGRSGYFGRNRPVFYSDTAAPRIEKLLRDAPPPIKGHIASIAKESGVRKLIRIPEQQTRLDYLVEITSSSAVIGDNTEY